MGNYINDINYTPNNVAGTDKLSTGHADVHNDDQAVISELVDNQAILDDALAQKVDSSLPDRVETLEEVVKILAQGLEATFWSIGGNSTVADGEVFPAGPDGNIASTWADVTELHFSTVTHEIGTHAGRPFSISTLLEGEIIRLTEAEVDATINPVNGFLVALVTAINVPTNSVEVEVQYASGSPAPGEFAVSELFPPQEEIDLSEYATMTWSNSQFSLINHTHPYSSTSHGHSDYAASDHGHSGYWVAQNATYNTKGIGRLGKLDSRTSSSGMDVGQLWWNASEKRVKYRSQ